MRRHTNIFRLCVWVSIGLVLFLVAMIYLISRETVSKFIYTGLGATPYDIVDSVINYLSLVSTILLGIIVYFQAQKINNLEISQYEVFLGVVGVKKDYLMGDVFLLDRNVPESDVSIIQSFANTQTGFLVNLNLGFAQAEKPVFVPLNFIIKSQPLITGLFFNQVVLDLLTKDQRRLKKIFENKGAPIYEIFENNSKFVASIGMRVPKEYEIDEIMLQFDMSIFDQLGREHHKKISISLKEFENSFCLYSSVSN